MTYLIDALQLRHAYKDGCYRYVEETIKAMQPLLARGEDAVLFLGDAVLPIHEFPAGLETLRPPPPHWLTQLSWKVKARAEALAPSLYGKLRAWRHGRRPPRFDTTPYNLLHVTVPGGMVHLKDWTKPLVMTVHDMTHVTVPEHHTEGNLSTTHQGVELGLRLANRVITNSDFTRRDLLRLRPDIDPERVVALPLGYDRRCFYPVTDAREIQRVRSRYGIHADQYVLSVCTLEARKNLSRVVDAFRALREQRIADDVQLVLVGRHGWKVEVLLENARLTDNVILTGYVPDDDLAALYSGARVFVYPSYYEGFGLPLLEALACGTPVIYGDNTSMPELVGGGGVGVDAHQTDQLVQALCRMLTDDGLHAELRGEGLRQASRFSWTRHAEGVLQVYREVLGGCAS